MRYYFAPMEGLTDSVYRRLHHKYFSGIDRYYMPFISPTIHRTLTHREDRELPFANREAFVAVPQVLTKVPEDFLWAAEQCKARGYEEVNLNLGCPSGTVVSKGKGAGMLGNLAELDRFLDRIFSESCLPVSVKTRLGLLSAEEFPALLEIFNRYPIRELTVHPRVRKAFYQGSVDMEAFRFCAEHSRNPLCYNGDLTNLEDIRRIQEAFPQVEAVMIGRGLIADPGMLSPGGTEIAALEAFHEELLETYTALFGGARNAMFRLKENWGHILVRFSVEEKLAKRLRKATDLSEYKAVTQEIFRDLRAQE